MNLIPKQTRVTFEEFCDLIADGQKADLIDGVIYLASPDNNHAEMIFGWLHSLMTFFVAAKDLGRVYGSRRAFRLGDHGGSEPDVAFTRKDRLGLNRWGYFDGPPDLAVEIVSPDSAERDYRTKRKQYQKAGVAEYWIIDPAEECVTLLELCKNGKFRESVRKRGVIRSRAVAGFWLRGAWLWQIPLPDPNAVLKEILSSQS
jgi:Uma2 family endonuclease